LTGQGEFLIGTPCANRQQETEDLIGPFSNPQVIRMRFTENDQLDAILKYVQEWTVGAIAHQILPFEDLNEDDLFASESNQMSLQVYFIYQKAFMQTQKTASLEIVPLRSISPGTMFDLTLSIVERSEGTRLQLEYNPGRHSASTVECILRLYVRILEAILSDSRVVVRVLPVLEGSNHYSERLNDPLGPVANVLVPAVGRQSEKVIAPRDAIEMQIAGIWETAMGLKQVSIRDSFFDLGGRSLAAMRIVSRINKTYSLDFGLATLFTGHTVERMADLVRKRLSVFGSSSIVPMQPHGSAAPLFIIHGAGGNIIRFYQLAMLLGTDHPVYGIQAQSLLAGQPALLHIEDQAAYYLSEIREIQPKGPYYFLGYSFGGTVALEIAHRLAALGEKIELLGMLDSRQTDCMVETKRKNSIVARIDRRIVRFVGNFMSLPFGEKVAYLLGKLVTRTLRWGYAIAIAVGYRSVPAFMKSTDDISWVAAMNYRTKPWPGKITLFRTAIQPDPRLPRDLGWSAYAEGGIEVIELPGDHDLIFRTPNIQTLADKVRDLLVRCDLEIGKPETVYAEEPAVVVADHSRSF
jgi:thioesterase domain-containing protein/acyl carrier protein